MIVKLEKRKENRPDVKGKARTNQRGGPNCNLSSKPKAIKKIVVRNAQSSLGGTWVGYMKGRETSHHIMSITFRKSKWVWLL